jgi:hypothetical protein
MGMWKHMGVHMSGFNWDSDVQNHTKPILMVKNI